MKAKYCSLLASTFLLFGTSFVGNPDSATATITTVFNSTALVNGAVSNSNSRAFSSYYFIFRVPEQAPKPIEAVTITQKKGADTVNFTDERVTAYQGNRANKKSELKLASVGGASIPGQLTVVFENPIQPGQTVTVAAKAKNPSLGGTYLFGIDIFPVEQQENGKFLGFSHINIFDDD